MRFRNLIFLKILLTSISAWSSDKLPQAISESFAVFSQRAEELYHSSAGTKSAPAPVDLTVKPVEAVGAKLSKTPDVFEYCKSTSRTILSKHRQFSDEWWEKLFGSCTGCPKEKDRVIDCARMLDENRQWKEVASMSIDAKRMIMKRALYRFYEDDDSCNLACALCADCNPDERLESTGPHTALHLVSIREHYGLFNLMLRKGADVNLPCIPALPIDFVPYGWIDELKSYGAKH